MTEQRQPDDASWAAWDHWMAGRRRPDPPPALLDACLPQGLEVRRSAWPKCKQFLQGQGSQWCLTGASAAFLVMAVFLIAGPSDTLADAMQSTQAASAIRIHGETSDGRIEMLWVRGVGRRVEQWPRQVPMLREDAKCSLEEFVPAKPRVTQCESGEALGYPEMLQSLLAELRRRAANRGDAVVEDRTGEADRALLRVRFPESRDQKAFYLDPRTRRIVRIEWRERDSKRLARYRFEYPRPEAVDRRLFAAARSSHQ